MLSKNPYGTRPLPAFCFCHSGTECNGVREPFGRHYELCEYRIFFKGFIFAGCNIKRDSIASLQSDKLLKRAKVDNQTGITQGQAARLLLRLRVAFIIP